jgi:hypothetical protein
VRLLKWFEALNKDFRYQLTPIGAPAPDLHIANVITKNQFKVAGGAPGMKVCWQVTGIRHPLSVEQDKRSKDATLQDGRDGRMVDRHADGRG